ncbi:MAG: ornithine carbamoyltransferase [Verrucomicrobiota bacterium]|nr:ornithine carbamoyltransferase [Verrucomicrobiota bacterium]
MATTRHFLKETDFTLSELAELLLLAQQLKAGRGKPGRPQPLAGQTWGMLFAKSSTRTRVSFEVGIRELGGSPLYLEQKTLQMDRGEPIADTARVLSRYLHGIVIRCHGHDIVEGFAQHGTMPVVNALTDFLHPCQIYSDLFTLAERWSEGGDLLKSLEGKKLAYYGDCASNMAHSWILGAAMVGMSIVLAGPKEFAPTPELDALLAREGLPKTYSFTQDPVEAARNADVLYTDVFVSMGREEEKVARLAAMQPYCVNGALLHAARPDALFLHCLPAHQGEEVTAEVFNSPQSIVFDQAENRLHMQKAILTKLVLG